MAEESKTRKNLQYRMRAIHRVLGYLAIGMVVVYALSGITLIYRMGNFLKHSNQETVTLSPGLTPEQLEAELPVHHFKVTEETPDAIFFNGGSYEKTTGVAQYTSKEFVWPMNKFVELHMLPVSKNTSVGISATVFGVILFLLALTSLMMYKPSHKRFKANMFYVGIGVALTILLLILT